MNRTRALMIAVCATGSLLCGACTSPPPRPHLPEDGASHFASLVEFKVDSSGKEHVLEMTAPTPGYQAKVVYIGEAFHEREVYVLIREPDPLYIYSAVVVKQRIMTGVDSTMPIRVLAEQIAFNEKPDPELYFDVMRAPGKDAPPAPVKKRAYNGSPAAKPAPSPK